VAVRSVVATRARYAAGHRVGIVPGEQHRLLRRVVPLAAEGSIRPNAHLVTGDLAEEVGKLKQQPGDNLLILDSPTLVRSLPRLGLLDELTINLCPIVLGSGLRLFDDSTGAVRVELVESRTYGTGVLRARYHPADA
jgi:dihydrofolate reductase